MNRIQVNCQTGEQILVPLTQEEIAALPVKTPAQIVAEFVASLESHYDSVARAKNYDNRYTCALRAGYAGPFQSEGQSFAQWMDECNAYGYQELAKIQNGLRQMPTIEQFLSELPAAPW